MRNRTFPCSTRRALSSCVTTLMFLAAGCGVSYKAVTNESPAGPSSPVISCAATPSNIVAGESVSILAKATSPSGLPISFTFETTAGSITSQGSSATLSTQGVSGNVTVTCKAADTQGQTAFTAINLSIQPPATSSSQPPIISCSGNPPAVILGDSTTISALASSPQGLPLTYSWSSSAGSISGTGSTAALDTSGAAAGIITVTCAVADTQGRTASATTKITATLAPSAALTLSCSANPSTVVLGGTAILAAVGTSPAGRPLKYSWSTPSGSISSTAGNVTLDTSGAAVGTITVTCKVADDQGNSTSATTSVIVVAPPITPPTISCSANPAIITQGAATTITAIGQSAQKLGMSYTFSASAGAITGTGSSVTLETSGISAGFVTVTCTADQQDGGTASTTTKVLLQSATGEQALTAFQFTDSVGVNLHLANGDSTYTMQFPAILNAIKSLGITHYRDGLNPYAPAYQYQNAETLGKAGIKADWLMDIHNSADIINSAYAKAPDATWEFEGPNEDDAAAGSTLSVFMQLLHDTVRSNPGTAAMPIIAPSFTQPESFATQGSLASIINSGNTHDYFGTRNPETAPYGGSFYNCGGYGSMQFNICLSQMVGVSEPVVSTETGYTSGTGLSDTIIGRYELRTLFESLRLGIIRTYLYELVDDPGGLKYGLLDIGFSPRPAYNAIKNTISLLNDTAFLKPGKLGLALTGQTQNVNHLLLQKGDGTFYLAIWLAVPSADPNNPSNTLAVASQNVILTSGTPISSTRSYAVSDDGNITASPDVPYAGSVPILVTDRITLIALSLGDSH